MNDRTAPNARPGRQPDPRDAFARRALSYLDGLLDDEQFAVLNAELATSREKQDVFVRLCIERRTLRETLARRGSVDGPAQQFVQWMNEDRADDDDAMIARTLIEEALESERDAVERRAQQEQDESERVRREEDERRQAIAMLLGQSQTLPPTRHIVIPRGAVYAAAAAMLALALALFWPEKSQPTAPPDATPQIGIVQLVEVGTIVESIDAKWHASKSRQAGAPLFSETMELVEGLAKLRFHNGAEVILQAPCTIRPVSAVEVELLAGQLVGTCRVASSKGFTIRTASARIVDLGTEFGVAIDEAGNVQTHVFNGEVQLQAMTNGKPSSEPATLQQGQALAVNQTGSRIEPIEIDQLAFVREQEFDANTKAATSAYHRWLVHSYAMRRRTDLVAYYPFELDESKPNRLVNEAFNTRGRLEGIFQGMFGTPQWTVGRWPQKQAVAFNRDGRQWIRVTHDKDAMAWGETITITMWLRIDDLSLSQHLLTQRVPGTEAINLVWNGDEKPAYPARSLLFRSGSKGYPPEFFLPTSSVREGRWTHLAVTFDGEKTTFYIDGKVVGHKEDIDSLHRVAADLLIGGVELPQHAEEQLQGAIDEVAIFNRALTAEEIGTLHQTGTFR